LDYFLSTALQKKEKLTALESGFSRISKKNKSRFSMQFFVLMVVFLFFDLELLLLFRLLVCYFLWGAIFIILAILGTFYLELEINRLKWKV